MKSEGFTLVEMLSVIMLLSIVVLIVSKNTISLAYTSKENLYCAKLELVKAASYDYGISKEKELNESTSYYDGYKSIKITINDLIISGFLEPDNDSVLLDPTDNSIMNNKEIILYLKNNKVNVYIIDSNCTRGV